MGSLVRVFAALLTVAFAGGFVPFSLLASLPAAFADRVKETSATTGTGNFTLSGAVANFRTFNATVGVGPSFPYAIVLRDGSQWEMGTGTLSSSTVLVRTTVTSSSSGGAAVDFGAGVKDVFLTPSAATFEGFALAADGDGYCLVDGSRVFTGTIAFEGATTDAFETTIGVADPTADNTITFKNASGTVAFTSDITNMSDADILDAAKRVDGAGSGLDADTLDGVSSAGFLATAGGTMTGGVVFNGVTTDITTATGDDLVLAGGGSSGVLGSVGLESADDLIDLRDSDGNIDAQIQVRVAGSVAMFRQATAYGGTHYIDSGSAASGSMAARTSAQIVYNVRDGTTVIGGGVDLFGVWGSGAFGVPSTAHQAITISTGDDATSPTSSQVELSCTTAPCTWKPGETSVVDGWQIQVCNVDAADNIDVASAAGTVIVKGSPRTMTPGECASCVYSGAIWGCQ